MVFRSSTDNNGQFNADCSQSDHCRNRLRDDPGRWGLTELSPASSRREDQAADNQTVILFIGTFRFETPQLQHLLENLSSPRSVDRCMC